MAFKGYQQAPDPDVPLAGAALEPMLPIIDAPLLDAPVVDAPAPDEPEAVPPEEQPSGVPVEEQPATLFTADDDGDGWPKPGTMRPVKGANLRLFHLMMLRSASELLERPDVHDPDVRAGAVILAAWHLAEPTQTNVVALTGLPVCFVRDVIGKLRRGHYITGSHHTRGRFTNFDHAENSGVAFHLAVMVGRGFALRNAQDEFTVTSAGEAEAARIMAAAAEAGNAGDKSASSAPAPNAEGVSVAAIPPREPEHDDG